jgi:hypothetical protein
LLEDRSQEIGDRRQKPEFLIFDSEFLILNSGGDNG